MAASAIVVPFGDLPAVVETHRLALTSDGAEGMPPHVTLISPFADAADLGPDEIGKLRTVLGVFAAFGVTFRRFGSFDASPAVLYLAPEPAEPFLDLIAALADAFPGFPPFGGVHETVVPHLTVAHTDDASALRAAERDVADHLPIEARVAEVALMERGADGWRHRERIPLTPPEGV